MDFIDYYQILEVDKAASEDDIRKAYRRLARKYHPDLNPNDPAAKQKFQQIAEANEVLSDPDKRKKYDQYGKDWKHADEIEAARQRGGWGPFTGGGARRGQTAEGREYFSGDEGGFSDFFEQMFGAGAGRGSRAGGAKYRGQDIQATLQLALRDVYQESKQTFSVGGRQVRITIPAGAEDGQTIRLRGYGGDGANGGPPGDLYITFLIQNDTPFRRDGADLYLDQELPLYTAILGGEIMINTLGGKLKLKVKPETAAGSTVRLRGKGFPVYKKEGEYGDLYVSFRIVLPTSLSARERELFEELKKLRPNG